MASAVSVVVERVYLSRVKTEARLSCLARALLHFCGSACLDRSFVNNGLSASDWALGASPNKSLERTPPAPPSGMPLATRSESSVGTGGSKRLSWFQPGRRYASGLPSLGADRRRSAPALGSPDWNDDTKDSFVEELSRS